MEFEHWAAAVGMFIGFCLVIGIPAIAILTHHQRKMAELIHKNSQNPHNDEMLRQMSEMRGQLSEMQNRQNELILQKHDQAPPPSPKVEDRIQD